MLDPFERAEQRAEDWLHSQDTRDGHFTCDCGNRCRLDDGETLSADPWSIPVCRTCFEGCMDERYGPNWRDKV